MFLGEVVLRISCFQRILCNSEQITNFKEKNKTKQTKPPNPMVKTKEETMRMEPKRYKVKYSSNDYSSYERDVLQTVEYEGNTLLFRCILYCFRKRTPVFPPVSALPTSREHCSQLCRRKRIAPPSPTLTPYSALPAELPST